MRRTYSYNAIWIGAFAGAAIWLTKSPVLGVIAGLVIAVGGFFIIRAIESMLYKATDVVVDKAVSAGAKVIGGDNYSNDYRAVYTFTAKSTVNNIREQLAAHVKATEGEGVVAKLFIKEYSANRTVYAHGGKYALNFAYELSFTQSGDITTAVLKLLQFSPASSERTVISSMERTASKLIQNIKNAFFSADSNVQIKVEKN